VTLIGQDPERYGFEFVDADPVAVETVSVPPATDLRRLAPETGLTLDTLRTLNPVLVRAITPPGAAWQLTVPVGASGDVLAALAPPVKRPAVTAGRRGTGRRIATGDDVHVVQPRDTVSSIAKQYGVSIADVQRWNRLEAQSRIRPGDRLRIAASRTALSDGQGGYR
jgi:nucleoid-associated protein YgaU